MTPGYDASVDYVAGLLGNAGYDVTIQPFDFAYYEDESVVTLDGETLEPFTLITGEGDYDVVTLGVWRRLDRRHRAGEGPLVPIGDNLPNMSTAC